MSNSEKIKELKEKLKKEDLSDADKFDIYVEVADLYFEDKKYDEAKKWVMRTSSNGKDFSLPYCYSILGVIYLHGYGNTPKDYYQAADYLEKFGQYAFSGNYESIPEIIILLELILKEVAKSLRQEVLTCEDGKVQNWNIERRGLREWKSKLKETKEEDILSIIKISASKLPSKHKTWTLFEDTIFRLGLLHYKCNSYDAAEKYLRLSIDIHPIHASFGENYYLGCIYYYGNDKIKKDLKKAEFHLIESIRTESKKEREKIPHFSQAKLLLGKINIEKKSFKKAAQYFEASEKAGCKEASYHLGLMHFLGRHFKKSYKDALDCFSRAEVDGIEQNILNDIYLKRAAIFAEGEEPDVTQDQSKFLFNLERAAENNCKEAIELLIKEYQKQEKAELVTKYQQKLKDLALKADTYAYGMQSFKDKNYSEAKTAFESFLAEEKESESMDDDKMAQATYRLAIILLEGRGGVVKVPDKAKELFLGIAEKLKAANFYLQRIYFEEKDFDAVIKYGKRYLDDNTAKITQYNLGFAYQAKNKLSKAISYYKKAAFIGSYEAYCKLEEIYKATLAGSLKSKAAYYLAIILMRSSHIESMRARTQNPENFSLIKGHEYIREAAADNFADANVVYGRLLLDENKEDKAVLEFQKAAQKNHPAALFELGNIFVKNERWEEAITHYQKSIEGHHEKAVAELKLLENRLITKLLYKNKRHKWDSQTCVSIRQLINKINKKYEHFTEKNFNDYIEKEEKEKQDFFGADLSEDSDDGEEEGFKRCSIAIKESTHIHSYGLFNKADHKQAKDKLKIILHHPAYDSEQQILEPKYKIDSAPTPSQQVLNDLKELNHRLQHNELEHLKISTKFLVVQFRGITYKTTDWNTKSRRWHRRYNEIDKPLFSAAAHAEAKIPYQQPLDAKQESKVLAEAEKIRQQMLDLEKGPSYTANFEHNGVTTPYKFSHIGYFLQNKYTLHYDGFFKMLKELIAKKVISLPNAQNPHISMGDIPLHPLKYAYGIKPYSGQEHQRLRPRWNNELRAERPYSGKVYLSLHPISDYQKNGPFHHLVSLNYTGEVHIDSVRGEMIMQERETSFFGYLPADRIKHVHVAKYPSFKGEYKTIYEAKYGIDKKFYELFQKAFQKYPPHSPGNKQVKVLLGEYLCHYHQVRLMDRARQLAKEQEATLVFLDQYGNFSLDLPPAVPAPTGNARESIRGNRKRRMGAEDEKGGKEKKSDEQVIQEDTSAKKPRLAS